MHHVPLGEDAKATAGCSKTEPGWESPAHACLSSLLTPVSVVQVA